MATRWKRNEKCEQPRLICFLDTESYEVPPLPGSRVGRLFFRLGVVRSGVWDGGRLNATRTVRFDNTAQFWRFLGESTRSKQVLWVFAHNIMFDLWSLGFPEVVQEGEFSLSVYPQESQGKDDVRTDEGKRFRGHCSLDSGSVLIKGLFGGRRINFVDTFNYFRCSVESLGTSINLPKLVRPTHDADNSEWFTYCERDVEIIQEATTGLMREWRANDLGNWQPTIASLAFSSYRHRFMDRPIIAHNHLETTQYEHQAYYDGRTTPLYVGTVGFGPELFPGESSSVGKGNRGFIAGPAYEYDIRSLYPSVMLHHDYPVDTVCDRDGNPVVWNPPSIEWFREQLKSFLCVAVCKLDTDSEFYPVRKPKDGHLGKYLYGKANDTDWRNIPASTVYPIGRLTTVLCTPEIKLALEYGHLREVTSCVFYHPWRIWDEWVNYWWQRKHLAEESGNNVRQLVCKILLNSLAGKLGQRNRFWTNTQDYPAEHPWHSWAAYSLEVNSAIPLRSIGWQVQRQVDYGWSNHALVAAAAHVNSYARVRMVRDMLLLPDRSILYVANDGMLVTADAHNAIQERMSTDPKQIGSYKLKGIHEYAEFFGPRDYIVNGEERKAGLPKDRERTGRRKWSVRTIENHQSMINRLPDGSVHTHFTEVSGTEHHWGQYDPGDGWLRPIRVAMWG